MNIFVLSTDVVECAQYHNDKHVVKMILEYAQLLSTAHRLLDGHRQTFVCGLDKSVKPKSVNLLDGEFADWHLIEGKYKLVVHNMKCYSATHANHPCAIWARETKQNYEWLYKLFVACCDEYSHRYGRVHATFTKIGQFLASPPKNISNDQMTTFPQAMPDEFKHEDPVRAYRQYYLGPKARMASWTNRGEPIWVTLSKETSLLCAA